MFLTLLVLLALDILVWDSYKTANKRQHKTRKFMAGTIGALTGSLTIANIGLIIYLIINPITD